MKKIIVIIAIIIASMATVFGQHYYRGYGMVNFNSAVDKPRPHYELLNDNQYDVYMDNSSMGWDEKYLGYDLFIGTITIDGELTDTIDVTYNKSLHTLGDTGMYMFENNKGEVKEVYVIKDHFKVYRGGKLFGFYNGRIEDYETMVAPDDYFIAVSYTPDYKEVITNFKVENKKVIVLSDKK